MHCDIPPTPMDCVGKFDECSANCTKTFTVSTYNKFGGLPCKFVDGQEKKCAYDESPFDACEEPKALCSTLVSCGVGYEPKSDFIAGV